MTRVLAGVTASVEKRVLLWLAARMPAWVSSDQLTALALTAMVLAGASFWLSRYTPLGLPAVVVCLALNWFGDSLDGTLARVRRQERPRYGFYVDHVVDALGAACLLAGLALSGYMSPLVAIGLLAAYLMLCVETFLATYCLGRFTMSHFGFGPTELRLLLATGSLALLKWPTTELAGRMVRVFDIGGVCGIAGMLLIFLYTAAMHTRELSRAEPLVPNGTQRRLNLGGGAGVQH